MREVKRHGKKPENGGRSLCPVGNPNRSNRLLAIASLLDRLTALPERVLTRIAETSLILLIAIIVPVPYIFLWLLLFSPTNVGVFIVFLAVFLFSHERMRKEGK